ncbi:MAG TPA: hypothetical protein VN898_15025 [Candidatus Binatia bacterium]|nr:hypothetical protein [Candidatus Binatia bacterium]
MSLLVLVKAMLIAAVVLLFLAAAGTIAYRITERALEVLILGRVIRRIDLADIEEVHRRGALIHENWSSLKFWNSVTVRRRSGWFRNFVISPDDPDRFVARLQDALSRWGGPLTG